MPEQPVLTPREAAHSTGQGMRSTRASMAGGYRDGTGSAAGSKRGSMAGGAALSQAQPTADALAAAGRAQANRRSEARTAVAADTASLYRAPYRPASS